LPKSPFDPVDHLLALDPGRRGIAAFFRPGAARAAADALRGAGRVLITTGFVVEPNMPETDGPPGAAVLGRALRTLGAQVGYVTDPVTVPVLSAALSALGEPADVAEYPDGPDAADAVLDAQRPTHLIAIERPARCRSGDYLNARGHSVAAWNRPIDAMFLRHRGASTIGVGDGGNEVGMGNVRARLAREGPLMARIASTVTVDHLVVAGVSNWGAYGIAAHLGRAAGRSLLHTPAQERALIAACVKAGASDGVTRRQEPTVDALPLNVHASFVALLGVSWDG
jgi:Domain of unknown function (DUF4392)